MAATHGLMMARAQRDRACLPGPAHPFVCQQSPGGFCSGGARQALPLLRFEKMPGLWSGRNVGRDMGSTSSSRGARDSSLWGPVGPTLAP